ncbi:hypothetical protein [Fictibacillus sp. 7GRE50]|nr:hypothetical protein [Fictibacillus sp. 7GRE50]
MRHLRVKRTAHRLPIGKRAAWNGNQTFKSNKVYENYYVEL